MDRAIVLPNRASYILKNARVPLGCMEGVDFDTFVVCVDRLAIVDIEVRNGAITNITPADDDLTRPRRRPLPLSFFGPTHIDLHGKMILPTFSDLHTHIDKGHTTERSRNPDGSLSGADRSTAADAQFWDADDVLRRMDFSVKCAYAHGTSAIRTHLINMTPKQTELTWPAFSKLRNRWRGRVDVQGVSLVALSFFRDEEAARKLADVVAEHKGLLGAAVCCAERGGHPEDDWTTCEKDRDELLDRIFTLAKERNLDIDFHTDENGNELAKGLRYVAQKTIEHGYQGRVVCGHCCSLAYQLPDELEKTLTLASEAGITIVSLPLVNQWTQDRDHHGGKTPRWRGIPLLHEAKAAGVPVAIASDNTRDQFYAYGDLDMLEVFNQGCRMAHLDRPYGDWVQSVTSTPANAMGLTQQGRLYPGGGADFIIFRARRYSELLSRPQLDRVVVRKGKAIGAAVPDYCELDYVPDAIRSGDVPVFEVSKYGRGGGDADAGATSVSRLGQSGMIETVREANSQRSNGGVNEFGGFQRWSGHVGSGYGGRKISLMRGGGNGAASISNAEWLAVFAVLAAVFAILASTYGFQMISV